MSQLEIFLVCTVALVAGYAAVRWLFKKDTEIEDRRRSAAKLAATLTSFGLKRLPNILLDYSVGDYSGMAQRIKEFVDLFLTSEEAVVSEFSSVFDSVLAAKLKTEEGRAFVAAKLSDASKDSDSSSVKNAPQAQTVSAPTALL